MDWEKSSNGTFEPTWNNILRVIEGLSNRNPDFALNKYFFSVPDPRPRHILVEIRCGRLVTTGILGWESGMFAPFFMSHIAPLLAMRPKHCVQ